ncbi:hypothetical protein LAZ40_05545 [Cereibacter sphaeroides]|uniref:hypothetical protein n=1 Tax=Cereibacter sphaeroides TaxID=1063 RepID=UPI001F36FD70|nr:hypothetical protein [Cereibacter sphaeroides]MCE6958513.1 hypothetical protein [Cereibacter sphaeroides]MCE6972825.1 hypothetical protein [Cereibacter sphaeroides]
MSKLTAIGNRIDDRLAHGMARTMLRRFFAPDPAPAAVRMDISSMAGRRRILQHLIADAGVRHVGIASDKSYFRVRHAVIDGLSIEDDPDSTWKLMLTVRSINLSQKKGFSPDAIEIPEVVGVAGDHVVARMFQRGGMDTEKDVAHMFRACGGWMLAARDAGDPAPFYIPRPQGLVCVRMERMDVVRNAEATDGSPARTDSFHIPSLSTFIDTDSFAERTRRIWTELSDMGGMTDPFPFPALGKPTSAALAILERSRELGRTWLSANGMELEENLLPRRGDETLEP